MLSSTVPSRHSMNISIGIYGCSFRVTYIGYSSLLFVEQGYYNKYYYWRVSCNQIKILRAVDSWELHTSRNNISWIQTYWSISLSFTITCPHKGYFFPIFRFYLDCFNCNEGLSWHKIINFRHYWIFPQCLIVLDSDSLMVSGYPAFIEIDELRAHWISSSSCYKMIGMTLVSVVTFYFISMIGSCAFFIVGL